VSSLSVVRWPFSVVRCPVSVVRCPVSVSNDQRLRFFTRPRPLTELSFERRATDNEQRTTDNEQRTTDNDQRTTNNGQRTTDNGQRTTTNGQRTMSNEPVLRDVSDTAIWMAHYRALESRQPD